MKKNKTPKLFRKSYTEKSLNNKILKRIHIPEDRNMVSDLFVKDTDEKYKLIEDISEVTLKKLTSLSKSIKKNRGLVTTWKAVIVILILSIVLIFNLIFKDKMIKSALESGLEKIFQAEVVLEEPHLSLLKGTFSFQSLSIADADNPMFNLIETGEAKLGISISELTRKRFKINEMLLHDVRWNTNRSDDGSLSDVESANIKSTKEEVTKEESGTLDFLAFNPEDFDYMSLLESQKDNLKSLQLINQSNQQINELSSRWTAILKEKEKEINNLAKKIDTIKSFNLNSISSVEGAQNMLQQVQAFYPEVEVIKNSINSLNNDFNSEKGRFTVLADSISSAINSDLSYLNSLVDFSSGNMKSIASDYAENYIRNRWESYYQYGIKALSLYKRFNNREKDDSKDRKGLIRSSGRHYLFPSPESPSFLIDKISLSGGDDVIGELSMEILSISNEPDKVSDPLSFLINFNQGVSSLNLNGLLNLRSDSINTFEMYFTSPDNSLYLDQGIPALSIKNIRTSGDISGKSILVKNGNMVSTNIDVVLTDIVISQADSDSFLSTALSSLFNNLDSIELKGEVVISPEGIDKVSVQSDLDDLLTDSVGDFLDDLEKTVGKELNSHLLEYISPELEINEVLSSSLNSLGLQSLGQISSVNDLEKILDGKIGELENKADSILNSLKSNILDTVKDTIKIPGF